MFYYKIPRFLFIIPITGIDTSNFLNSKICDNRDYDATSAVINEPIIANYFLQRIALINDVKNNITDSQKKKSSDLYLKNQSEISEKDLGIINKYINKQQRNNDNVKQ